MSQNAPELEATEARQGRRSGRVVIVLAVSLALVVVAFAAVWAAHWSKLSGHGGQQAAPAEVAQSVDTVPNTATTAPQNAPAGSVAAQAAGTNARTAGG